MQLKTFIIAASAAAAMAQVESALGPSISPVVTLNLEISPDQSSIFSELEKAMPSSLQSAITDPAVQSSLASEMSAGHAPAWWSGMPENVKSYIIGGASETGNMPLSSVASSLTAAANPATSSASARAQAEASSATGASSSMSAGGAPAPTAAIVASMAGVVGVLALAIGL